MHCKFIDHYFNLLFVEIQLKKENLKNAFWAPEFGRPNWYIGFPNGLKTSVPCKHEKTKGIERDQ